MMVSVHWEEAGNRVKQALGLSHAPIAITFSQEAPSGIPFHEGKMGSVANVVENDEAAGHSRG